MAPQTLLSTKSLFLFDVDGTILDTMSLVLKSFEHTLRTHGLPAIPFEMIAKFQGRPLEECYAMIADGRDFNLLCDTHRTFQEQSQHLVEIFEDTIETLDQIQREGKHVAAVSTRSKRTLPGSLRAKNIESYFDLIVAAEDVSNHKPHPEPVLKALDYFRLGPEDAVMIGDTSADINAGKAAGVMTVGVTYGFEGEKIRSAMPTYVIDRLGQLLTLDT